jgi:hypothetical protein
LFSPLLNIISVSPGLGYLGFAPVMLHHFPIVQPNLWSQYVTIFRHYSWELFALVNNYANQFPSYSLLFHKWISGGLVFYITPRTVVYDLG